ncbi:MAG: alpha/beta hydrolase [Pseudomonadales bacterium]|nr:alpha/beta hydrolase [Pseudomonadales bacterium]
MGLKITAVVTLLFSLISFVPIIANAAVADDKRIPDNPDFLPGSESYTYKVIDDINLRLHVFGTQTASSEPKPAIVFFFGGALRTGKVMQFVSQAKALSKQGMLAVVADYRVLLRHNTGPSEAIADAQSAVRWLRENAQVLNLDPDRVVSAGGSAGGYLAAATATVAEFDTASAISSKPNAVALFNPALAGKYPRVANTLSPYQQLVDESVPTFIVHGKQDDIVPFSSASAYCDKVLSLNGYCELHAYEEAGHGFFNRGRNGGQWYSDTLSKLEAFLTRLGYLN